MSGTPEPAAPSAADQLHKLLADEWDYEMPWDPTRASELGDRRWNDRRWPERTIESLQKDRDHRAAA